MESAVEINESGKRDSRAVLMIAVALLVVGIAMIYSAGAVMADKSPRFGDRTLFLRRQLLWSCVGILAMLATCSIPFTFWSRIRTPLLVGSFLLLVAVFVPGIGLELNGEHRWIRIGSYQIQPSEFCRLSLSMVLCAAVASGIREWRQFLPWAGVILAASGLILFERDVGSAIVLATLLSLALFVGGARLKHILLTGAVASAGLGATILFAFPHARERIADFFSTEPSYQVQQSIMAVGSGGWFGDGLGAGRAKLFYLPEAQSDFIFAIFAEELGFMGALGLVLLYGALLVAGWRIARRCTDPFGRTLTFAIVASIIIGALINIAVAIGALPAKGIPLPFVSYGGSSLVVSMAAVGILMNIAERSPTTTDETADQRRRDGRAPYAGDRAGAGLAPAES